MTTETTVVEAPPVDPAIVANATPEPAPPLEPVEVTPEPTPEPTPQEHGNKGKKPWFLERISEESQARIREKERADNLQAMLDRLSAGQTEPAATTHTSKQPDDAAIEARAQQLLAQRQIQTVINAGLSKYSDWDSRAEILGHAGAASPEFVSDVLGVAPTNAHEILAQLADDPAKAARLAKMDTRARTIELVKMSMAQNMPVETKPSPTRTVSKAPTPAPAVEPSTAQIVDWRSDKATDEDFSRGWDAMMAERAKRGRR